MRRLLVTVVLAGLLASPALAAQASPAAATGVHGWRAAPGSVVAGAVFRSRVTVDGGARTVLLQRRVGGEWRTVDRERSTSGGTAVLRWRTPKRAGSAVLRLLVRPSAGWTAARTRAHRVATTPAATPSPTPAAGSDPTAARVLALVNEARATARTCGDTAYPAVAPLAADSRIDAVAQAYAARMAVEGFFSHTAPDGRAMVDRMHAAGFDGWLGENIAAGQPTADAVVAGWLASPGHCANIMGAHYTRLGTGLARSTTATYGTYWVQDFSS